MALHRTIVGILVAAATLCGQAAHAQVTQPQYVRPSKGAALTLVPSVTASSVVGTFTTSALFDWSAFAGVIVTVNQTGQGTFSACKYGVNVRALGSSTTNAADFFLLNVANNDYRANASQAWYVRVLPGYLRFSIGTYQATPDGAPSCAFKVTATPLPFDYSGKLASSGAFTEFYEGPAIIQNPYGYPTIRFQNTDTNPLACYARSLVTGSFYTGGRYAFLLKADSTGNTGDGGVIELKDYAGELRCAGTNYIVFGY